MIPPSKRTIRCHRQQMLGLKYPQTAKPMRDRLGTWSVRLAVVLGRSLESFFQLEPNIGWVTAIDDM